MIVKIAQIKDDHTWSEMEIRVQSVGFAGAAGAALNKARSILGYYDNGGEYPENIIALHVLGVEEAKASCSTSK